MERDPDRTTLTLPLKEESANNHQIKSSDSNEDKTGLRTGKTAQNKQAIAEYLTINGPSKSSDIADAIGLKVARTNQILREMLLFTPLLTMFVDVALSVPYVTLSAAKGLLLLEEEILRRLRLLRMT